MPRPCHLDHPLAPATCRLCHLTMTDPDYAALWEEPIPIANIVTPKLGCRHFGPFTGELRDCATCPKSQEGRSKTRAKLHACAIHGVCTATLQAVGTTCCRTCKDYPPPSSL